MAPAGIDYPMSAVRIGVLLACLVSGSQGRAMADEDDWQIAGRAGVAGVVVDGRDPLGVGLGSTVQYGLNDVWSARVSVSGGLQRASVDASRHLPGGNLWSYSGFAGIGYSLDVLRLLPTFEVGLGVLGVAGAVKSSHMALGTQLGVGADYLLTPRFSVGATAQYVFAPFDLLSRVLTGDMTPLAFAFSARATWTIR